MSIVLDKRLEPIVDEILGQYGRHQKQNRLMLEALSKHRLLPQGWNLDLWNKDEQGRTLMHLAAEQGLSATLEVLIQLNMSPAIRDYTRGEIPLHAAARSGDADSIRVLAEEFPGLEILDKEGHTPLHVALLYKAREGNLVTVKALLEAGSSPQMRFPDTPYDSPLHWAAREGNLQVAKILLEYGADLYEKNGKGELPFDLAASVDLQRLLSPGIRKKALEHYRFDPTVEPTKYEKYSVDLFLRDVNEFLKDYYLNAEELDSESELVWAYNHLVRNLRQAATKLPKEGIPGDPAGQKRRSRSRRPRGQEWGELHRLWMLADTIEEMSCNLSSFEWQKDQIVEYVRKLHLYISSWYHHRHWQFNRMSREVKKISRALPLDDF